MPRSRILITGASGLLGGHLCLVAGKECEVFGAYHFNQTLAPNTIALRLDLSEEASVLAQLSDVRPQIVIHAAVMQVDACEREPELAERVNVIASRRIAEWCEEARARLVYISSDLVFDGAQGDYVETDAAHPLMLYGKNKLVAEQAVLAACPSACVARLPLMYGFPVAGGSNFFLHLLARLQRGERVPVFHDQYRTPGLVNNMAEALWELARTEFRGVLHLAGATRCSREDFARVACRLAGLNETLLDSVSMFEVLLPAARPQDVSLNCALAQRVLQTHLLNLEEGLRLALKNL